MADERVWPITPYGEWVYLELFRRRMTLKTLAAETGISVTSLSKFCHGVRPGVRYPEKVERVLGPPPPELERAS